MKIFKFNRFVLNKINLFQLFVIGFPLSPAYTETKCRQGENFLRNINYLLAFLYSFIKKSNNSSAFSASLFSFLGLCFFKAYAVNKGIATVVSR